MAKTINFLPTWSELSTTEVNLYEDMFSGYILISVSFPKTCILLSFEVCSKITGEKAKYDGEEWCVCGIVKLYRKKLLYQYGFQVFLDHEKRLNHRTKLKSNTQPICYSLFFFETVVTSYQNDRTRANWLKNLCRIETKHYLELMIETKI